ncbi:MAG: PAS domain-containing protein, partial [Planctomycetales bacterium]|nr:PAS domain-containing protein [Planctomycetales bacterium]
MTSADFPDETASFAFSTFFGSSKEGAVVLDLNGEVLDVNAAVLHLIKLDRAQVIGQRFDRLIDVDLGDSLPQILQSFAQASQPGPLDLSLPFAGQELAAQLRVIEYANAGALLLTIHAPLSVADVSLSAEGALGQLSILSPESDVRGGRIPLDLGVSECPLSLNGWPARLDLNGRQTLSAAPRRSLVRSYSGDRQAWLALIEEEDRERIRKATSQLLAGEVTTVQETYRVVCNTPQETFYVQETLTAVRHPDGSLDHWAGTLLDVTPLYRSRDRLVRYQHFAERILDAVPFLVFLFDFQNARVPFASHQSTELLGITPEEMRSRSQEFILRHL